MFILTPFILATTISLTVGDRVTKFTIKRPCSERASFTASRNGSSTKSTAGQVIPELQRSEKTIKKAEEKGIVWQVMGVFR